jgi:hypothetical protein
MFQSKRCMTDHSHFCESYGVRPFVRLVAIGPPCCEAP